MFRRHDLNIRQFGYVHFEAATALVWNGVDEFRTCGDDHRIIRWNLADDEVSLIADFPEDVSPLAMQWPPKSIGVPASGKKANELLLLTTTDGRLILLGRAGRLEKIVQAHKGAVISGNWSPDASEILTSGEDGYVRVWSRSGMLRSTLYHAPMTVYASCWGPEGTSVVFTVDKNLLIKSTTPGTKPTEWKAHEELVICVSWSLTSRLIVSGGEDGKYNVWDSDGQLLYTSMPHESPITAVGWSPSGDLFAVGGMDFLRLCDRNGWCHCIKSMGVDRIYALQWSADGTQFAGCAADGRVFTANVTNRSAVWKNYEVALCDSVTVTVTEFTANVADTLQFPERVIQLSLDHGYIVVALPMQVFVYSVHNFQVPVICELRDNASVSLILQCKRMFTLGGSLGITTRNYEGRLISQIKWPAMQSEMLNIRTATLADDMVALIDQADRRMIRVFEPLTGKPLTEIRHKSDIIQIAFAQNEVSGPAERMLGIIDRTCDLYLALVRRVGKTDPPKKLSLMTFSIKWHTEAPILAVIRDSRLRIFYFPLITFIDETILDSTWEEREIGELGQTPEIVSYAENTVYIRRPDGVVVSAAASYFAPKLHQYTMRGQFAKARRCCRYVNDELLWGIMAGMATWKGDLSLAEICFSEIGHYDKVLFLRSIAECPDQDVRDIQKQLFCGGLRKAETALIKEGRLADAIGLNVRCMHWIRALELTIKYGPENMEDVLLARQLYLDKLNIEEYLPDFAYLLRASSTSSSRESRESEIEADTEAETETE